MEAAQELRQSRRRCHLPPTGLKSAGGMVCQASFCVALWGKGKELRVRRRPVQQGGPKSRAETGAGSCLCWEQGRPFPPGEDPDLGSGDNRTDQIPDLPSWGFCR